MGHQLLLSFRRIGHQKVLKILFLLLVLILPIDSFSSSPRLLISLGIPCDFSVKDLQKEMHILVVSGTREEMKAKIEQQEKSKEIHTILIQGEFEDLDLFAQEIGYDTICLTGSYEAVLKELKAKILAMPVTDADLIHLTPKEAGLFYDLMMRVDKVFRKNHLSYWATGGTLLGAVRHQGIIPWDDDLDIAILEKDIPLLEKIRDDLAKEGLELFYRSSHDFYKIYFKNGSTVLSQEKKSLPWTYPSLDVFLYKEQEGKFVYASALFYDRYPQEYFHYDELKLPFAEISFGPMSIPVPHCFLDIIHRMYGSDWNRVAYSEYDHRKACRIKKIKVDLVDQTPAIYELP